MRSASRHILFLATEYDAPGMRPYASNIINTLWQEGDHVLIVTRDGADPAAFPGIPEENIIWIDYPASKLQKALFRFYPSRVLRAIDRLIDNGDISLIYSLTEELVLADCIRRLQRRVHLLYTVHDASFHDYQFQSVGRWLKDRLIIARPQRLMLKRTLHQVTNSREQLDAIISRYPYHKVHYAPFPTLVNDAIAQGGTAVPELEAVSDGYILFFGTLHLYKGVHLLYEAYRTHPELQDRPLVIAGTQSIYFNRSTDEKNVIFINRFIDDSEVKDLFSRAAVVVYPYISATQSGVTSIASYFDKPMVLSDLKFFTQTCEHCEGVEFFHSGDTEALAGAIGRALQSAVGTRSFYDCHYAPESFAATIAEIIRQL